MNDNSNEKLLKYHNNSPAEFFESKEGCPVKEFVMIDHISKNTISVHIPVDEDGTLDYSSDISILTLKDPYLPEFMYNQISSDDFEAQYAAAITAIDDIVAESLGDGDDFYEEDGEEDILP